MIAKKRLVPFNGETVFGATTLPAGDTEIKVEITPPYVKEAKPQVVATSNVNVSVSVPHADGDGFTFVIASPADEDIDISWSMTVGPRSPFRKPKENFFDDDNPPKRKHRENNGANAQEREEQRKRVAENMLKRIP